MIVLICVITGGNQYHTFHLAEEDPPLEGKTLKGLKSLVAREFCRSRWGELSNPPMEYSGTDGDFDHYFETHPVHFAIFTTIQLKLANVVSNPNAEWGNDAVQFPRLITEARDIGLFDEKSVQTLGFHMSLGPEPIKDLIDRAAKQTERARMEISEEFFV